MNMCGPLLAALRAVQRRPATTTVETIARDVCGGDMADARATVRGLVAAGWAEVVSDLDMGEVVLLTAAGEDQARGTVRHEGRAVDPEIARAAAREAYEQRRSSGVWAPPPESSPKYDLWRWLAGGHSWSTTRQAAQAVGRESGLVGAQLQDLYREGYVVRSRIGRVWLWATRIPLGGPTQQPEGW